MFSFSDVRWLTVTWLFNYGKTAGFLSLCPRAVPWIWRWGGQGIGKWGVNTVKIEKVGGAICMTPSSYGGAAPVCAPGVWNDIFEYVKSSVSLYVFKSQLKTELFFCTSYLKPCYARVSEWWHLVNFHSLSVYVT